MVQKVVSAIIAQELKIKISQVEAAIRLLDEGASVPFIARYRKEATNGLNDTKLRELTERLHYIRELNERREVVLQSIREQGKLTEALEASILAVDTKARLEDLYLPYRPKRRTKAQTAREAGLEPLAMAILNDPNLNPEILATQFINTEAKINDVNEALEGARQILMEHFTEDAKLIDELREYLWQHAMLKSVVTKDKKIAGKNSKRGGKKEIFNKYSDYFDYAEPIKKIQSHRALALFRGRREHVLQLSLVLYDDTNNEMEYGVKRIASYFNIVDDKRTADQWLLETVQMSWKLKLFTKLELELLARLRELADAEAIRVFGRNLRGLLLAAPVGAQITMGLDPGLRTGVKAVVIDATGKVLDYTTIFPFSPENKWHESIVELAKLTARYHVNLLSIGNGTGSRETERLITDMMTIYPDLAVTKVIVSEAGASVYAASQLAADEFPELDVTLRGAVSIARRLQDPLAELVKIEPKAIGVGQYQHDINQNRLARCLEGIVEDCVNLVGVDVNTASIPLLTKISGFNETLAKNLVQYRDEHGTFSNRNQLKNIPKMGEKSFQQSAGFLRIMNGDNPLDASSVHPEAYPLVKKILETQQVDLTALVGNHTVLKGIEPHLLVDDMFGLPTVCDVLKELERPGRDPRPRFKMANFKDGVVEIGQLHIGMILEGIISNVTNFGAFVDIGVHQDGLVHISEMTQRFITDPHSFVKVGDVVTVKVIDLDLVRHRISLSMRLQDKEDNTAQKRPVKLQVEQKAFLPTKKITISQKYGNKDKRQEKTKQPAKKEVFNTAMADALSKLKLGS